jgi:hypothetical protein
MTTMTTPTNQEDKDIFVEGPILQSVRDTKRRLSESYGHSLQLLFERIEQTERTSGRTYIDLSQGT